MVTLLRATDSSTRPRYTAEEDRYIITHHLTHSDEQIGWALGRGRWAVRNRRYVLARRGQLNLQTKPPEWTPAEDARLLEMLEDNRSYKQIAKALGRTEVAITLRCNRNDIPRLSKASGMTARAVARLMGIDEHVPKKWIAKDVLKGTHYPMKGSRPYWRIEEEDLIAFLENEEHWHLWIPAKMKDLAWREWAQEMREGVEFVGTRETARILGWCRETITRRVLRGQIPARKLGFNWMIRKSDLIELQQEHRR